MTVYRDIKARKIQWPEDEESYNKKMSIEAQDLVNRMIQLDPQNRLGHNLESIKVLKTHPFFAGIDFAQVSKRSYKGLLPIVEKLIPAHLGKLNEAEEMKRQSLMNVGMGTDFNPLYE